jgi:hypothetical protein
VCGYRVETASIAEYVWIKIRLDYLLEQATIAQPLKKFPAFYTTGKFITVFTKARQRSLS